MGRRAGRTMVGHLRQVQIGVVIPAQLPPTSTGGHVAVQLTIDDDIQTSTALGHLHYPLATGVPPWTNLAAMRAEGHLHVRKSARIVGP